MSTTIPLRKKRSSRRADINIPCPVCSLAGMCSESVVGDAEAPGKGEPHRRRLKSGELLLEKGDVPNSIYAVKSGFLKTCAILPNGERQIVGFSLPGDAVGMDVMASGVSEYEITALEDSDICEIVGEPVEKDGDAESLVSERLRELLCQEVASLRRHVVTLSAMTAKQRVAVFLLDMASRWSERGHSSSEFILSVTRREIGNYLGLTFETVSRALSEFDVNNWINVNGKHIKINNRQALYGLLTASE